MQFRKACVVAVAVLVLAVAGLAQTTPSFGHVVVVAFENQDYSSIVGNTSAMPYLNSLINQYGLATNFFADANGSIPDYFAVTTGQQITQNADFSGTVTADNIVREILAAGKTWKSYAQSIPGQGYTGTSGYPYVKYHNPFAYFSDVLNSSAQTNRLVGLDAWVNDVNNGTLPNYSFVVPDNYNNAHDCPGGASSCANGDKLATADAFLSNFIDPLFSNAQFQQDGLLIIWWDEGTNSTNGGGHVVVALMGPKVKSGFQSGVFYRNSNLLRTICEALGLPNYPGAAANASSMTDFFTAGSTTGTISGTVTDSSTAKAIAGATVSYSGGSAVTNASGQYTLSNVPAGSVSVTASASGYQTKSATVTVTAGATTTSNFALTPSPAGPVVSVSVNPANGTVPLTVTATVTASEAGGTISSTSLNFGDGSATVAGPTASHTYNTAGTYTITATATDANNVSSQSTVSVTVNPVGGAPVINYGSGFTSSGLVMNGNAVISGTRLRLTNGSLSQISDVYFGTKVNIQSFTTDFTFQLTNAQADGFTFMIQNSSTSAMGDTGGNLGYQGIANSAAIKFDLYDNKGEGNNSTGFYTGGAAPTVPAIDLTSSGINLHSGDVFAVHITYNGTTLTMTITDQTNTSIAPFTTSWTTNLPSVVGANTAWVGFSGTTGGSAATQDILTWTYSNAASTPTAATPTFNPAPGTYTTTQSVTISDTTSGAVIHYTTDGSTPTASSTTYTGPISVAATTTIKAIAVASGFQNSAVATATYTIQAATAATPTFSPAPGTYTTTQSVTISDTTSGAVIHYTTDGSTPTASSTTYTGPISVAATTTIKAIAVASGFQNSAVATATYTIQAAVAATPTFSPAPGTYTTTQSVTISDTTSGAVIHYTTDGSTPTASSTTYTGPISVAATTTIKAIAVASGFQNSAVGTATYTIQTASTTGTISGTVTDSSTKAAISGATVGYSGGSTTTNASGQYTLANVPAGNVSVTVSATGYTSQTATVAVTAGATTTSNFALVATSGTLVINYGSGFTSSGLVMNGNAAISGTRLRLTNGSLSQISDVYFGTKVNIQSFTTDFTFQLTNAQADGFTFLIQNSNTSAMGDTGGNLGYQGITNSAAIKFDLYDNKGEGNNSTGFYTGGAAPTIPAVDLTSSGINLHSGDVFAVHITYNGTTLTMTITDQTNTSIAPFTTSWATNLPTVIGSNTAWVGFSGTTGGLAATQDILTWTYKN